MGKVYDALQRAEQQRARRAGEPDALEAALRPGGGLGPAKPAKRPPFWRRMLFRPERRVEEDAGSLNKRRIAMLQPDSFVTEQFRSLRARIDSLTAQQRPRSIAVTSAVAGEGKTTTAVNLALVMAMGVGKKVVLVDCDLRRPRVHHSLGVVADGGLAEVLRGEVGLDQAVTSIDGSTLRVLPVRALPPNPSELLASGRMQELIEKLTTEYDHVILDVPPTLGLPDAKIVTDLCDATLFVVRAHATPFDEIASALDVLDRSRLLGMVLNEADVSAASYGYDG